MTTVAGDVTVVRSRIGYLAVRWQFRREFAAEVARRAPNPAGLRAQLGAALAIMLAAVSGALSVDRRAVVDADGFATGRRMLRTAVIPYAAALVAAAAVLGAPVGIAVYYLSDTTRSASMGFAVLGGLAMLGWTMWVVVPKEETDDIKRGGVGTWWRRRCWVDVQVFIVPQARGQGIGKALAHALVDQLPPGEQAVARVDGPELMATYRRWWPDAKPIGPHHLHIVGR